MAEIKDGEYLVFFKDGKKLYIPKDFFGDAEKSPLILTTVFGTYELKKLQSRKIIET